MNRGVSRRTFLRGLAGGTGALACAGAGCHRVAPREHIQGSIVGASAGRGHLLRESPTFSDTTQATRAGVVIVGGGIAGLSAAWKLKKSGFDDFVVLELESAVGGNASHGSYMGQAYPWGAHYVPLPGPRLTAVRELFEELGVITGYTDGVPNFNEYFVCAAPQERLYKDGGWHEGILPQRAESPRTRAQYSAFFQAMQDFRQARGQDGKPAFALPIAHSSQDVAFLQLDHISMAEYMHRAGWDAPSLCWYVDYCCRDDYGCGAQTVSAWAGIHYFAARVGVAANVERHSVLTWPAGNGWIVQQLRERLAQHLQVNQVALRVQQTATGIDVHTFHVSDPRVTRLQAQAVIVAVPQFVAARLLDNLDASAFTYAPWMVANVHVRRRAMLGETPAWDNVLYGGAGLGYVLATHQRLEARPQDAHLTYYRPLDHDAPPAARRSALTTPYSGWRDGVLNDLEQAHFQLSAHVDRLDVWLWGHGMVRPTPGFLWGKARREAATARGAVYFAHSDLSGLSLFEEANYHGVRAAEQVLQRLGIAYASSLGEADA